MEIPGGEYPIKSKIVKDSVEIGQVNKGGKSEAQPSTPPGAGAEQVALSAEAKQLQQALEAVQNSPDIRIDRVNQIRTEIAEGRFQVDDNAVAEKILRELIVNPQFLD